MALPTVSASLSNGNLGRNAPSEDSVAGLIVSGVAVAGQFALGDILGPFTSLADAEALTINAAYDSTNTCLAFQHIKEFYDHAPAGSRLYVMVVAKTVTMNTICDPAATHAKKLLSQTGGVIRMLGITRVPDAAYVPTYTGQFEQDLLDAITKLNLLYTEEFNAQRPFSAFIEGRNFQGTVSSITNLRATNGPNAPHVAVVLGQDNTVATAAAHAAKYASVGIALGCAAAVPVQRNIGRVKNGPVKVVRASLSNGALMSTISDVNQNTLDTNGYVFFRQHVGLAGFYFNDDHTAAPVTNDYAQFTYSRTVNKAVRIAYTTYVNELLDEVLVDATTGKLSTAVIKHYQGILESAILSNMIDEISGVTVAVDANQNVLSTGQVKVVLSIVPVGTVRKIQVTIGFNNPAN
jgi:hypothetical protein